MNVFVLKHVHEHEDGTEDVKFIGAYSSRKNAEAAVARLNGLPGFLDAQDGFHIDEYSLDQDHWTCGFGATIDSAVPREPALQH